MACQIQPHDRQLLLVAIMMARCSWRVAEEVSGFCGGPAALVLMGDATARLWRPGEAPRAVLLPAGGWPILWYAGRLVLQDAERGRLLEVDWRP
jgi:hypothetical protein